MNWKVGSRWFVLGLIGVAILGAVLWINPLWTNHADGYVAPAEIRTSGGRPPEAAGAASAADSDMLRMTRAAFVACGAPAAPSDVPDGATATLEQMEDAHATVKAFDAATTIYTRCLDTTAYQAGVQFKAVATSADVEVLNALQIQLHNAAIDRDQVLANRFNVQLRRFKARARQ